MAEFSHLRGQESHPHPSHAPSRAGEVYRVLASSVVGVLVLAVVGAVLGPQWDPAPLTQPLQVQSSSTAISGPKVTRMFCSAARMVRRSGSPSPLWGGSASDHLAQQGIARRGGG